MSEKKCHQIIILIFLDGKFDFILRLVVLESDVSRLKYIFLALRFFAVGEFAVGKTEPKLIWPNLNETNMCSYGELSHGE